MQAERRTLQARRAQAEPQEVLSLATPAQGCAVANLFLADAQLCGTVIADAAEGELANPSTKQEDLWARDLCTCLSTKALARRRGRA